MYHVQITTTGGYKFNAKSKDAEFSIGLDGKTVTPPDVLLASLGSCMGVYLQKYVDGMKLKIPGFAIDLSAEFSKEAPVCFRKINLQVDLQGAVLDERHKKGLRQFLDNCPVHETLKANPEIAVDIK